jgi:hypothetical protein
MMSLPMKWTISVSDPGLTIASKSSFCFAQ